MISKTRLKELAKYKHPKNCDAENVFVVEGVKMADEALNAHAAIREVVATAGWLEGHPQATSAAVCHAATVADLERISGLKTPNEVWMLIERPQPQPAADHDGLLLLLDRIQDPGNLGTIIRTADWFGIRRILCSPDCASCYNPKVVQATMGGIFRTQVEYRDLRAFLADYPRPVYGALLDGQNLHATPLSLPAALVIGNESRGISEEVQRLVTHRITIPNRGGTCESLNASVATAIICSEFFRQ